MKSKLVLWLLHILPLILVILGALALLSSSPEIRIVGLIFLLSIPFWLALEKKTENNSIQDGRNSSNSNGFLSMGAPAVSNSQENQELMNRIQNLETDMLYALKQVESAKKEIWILDVLSSAPIPENLRLRATRYLAQKPSPELKEILEMVSQNPSNSEAVRKEADYGLTRIDSVGNGSEH